MKSKNNKSISRIKEIEFKLTLNEDETNALKEEKRQLENQLILPKVTEKHLGKYFLKPEFQNKKEKMLIHVREIISVYEYKGIKMQINTHGTLTIDQNYQGYFSSIGKEVNQSVWKEMVTKADDLISKI